MTRSVFCGASAKLLPNSPEATIYPVLAPIPEIELEFFVGEVLWKDLLV